MDLPGILSVAAIVVTIIGSHAVLRCDFHNEIKEFRTEFRSDITALRTEFRADNGRLDARIDRLEGRIDRLDDRVYALTLSLKPLIEKAEQAS